MIPWNPGSFCSARSHFPWRKQAALQPGTWLLLPQGGHSGVRRALRSLSVCFAPDTRVTPFLFFYTPTAPSASPRNTFIGHVVSAGAGYLSLVVTGLTMAGASPGERHDKATRHRCRTLAGADGWRDGAAAWPHPPAGATTPALLHTAKHVSSHSWSAVLGRARYRLERSWPCPRFGGLAASA